MQNPPIKIGPATKHFKLIYGPILQNTDPVSQLFMKIYILELWHRKQDKLVILFRENPLESFARISYFKLSHHAPIAP